MKTETLMNNKQDEIKEIIAQLNHLQIQQTELLQRLERLSEADRQATTSPSPTRELAIGDLVQIKNPKPLQIKKGTIIKIGVSTDRITVQSKNGSKIVRASFNLVHLG